MLGSLQHTSERKKLIFPIQKAYAGVIGYYIDTHT